MELKKILALFSISLLYGILYAGPSMFYADTPESFVVEPLSFSEKNVTINNEIVSFSSEKMKVTYHLKNSLDNSILLPIVIKCYPQDGARWLATPALTPDDFKIFEGDSEIDYIVKFNGKTFIKGDAPSERGDGVSEIVFQLAFLPNEEKSLTVSYENEARMLKNDFDTDDRLGVTSEAKGRLRKIQSEIQNETDTANLKIYKKQEIMLRFQACYLSAYGWWANNGYALTPYGKKGFGEYLLLSAFDKGKGTMRTTKAQYECINPKSNELQYSMNNFYQGEINMKEKIICEFFGKNGDIEIYDCFRLVCEDDAILKLYYIRKMKDFALDWLMNKADNSEYKIFGSRFHFPMGKVPEVVKTMTDAFYLGNPFEGRWSYTIALPDSEFTAGLSFDERSWVMDEYSLIQDDGDKIWEDIDLYWDMETMSKVPLKGTRVMPKSLAALIKGLRDFYNEWQKAHPECERME